MTPVVLTPAGVNEVSGQSLELSFNVVVVDTAGVVPLQVQLIVAASVDGVSPSAM